MTDIIEITIENNRLPLKTVMDIYSNLSQLFLMMIDTGIGDSSQISLSKYIIYNTQWQTIVLDNLVGENNKAIKIGKIYDMFYLIESIIFHLETYQGFHSPYPDDYRNNWNAEYVDLQPNIERWIHWMKYEFSLLMHNAHKDLMQYKHQELSQYTNAWLNGGDRV